MIDAIRSEDPIRSKIEALGTTLSLPTVRKALGILEGAHASDKRFGADDVMDIRIYEPGDEAKRIDWKTSARVAAPWWCSANAHPLHAPGFCSMSDRK